MRGAFQFLSALVNEHQHNRILRLSFPNDDGPSCQFVVNQLTAVEAMSRDFEFSVEILSDNASLALKDLQGKLFSVELVQSNGTLRYFSGYCFSFGLKKVDKVAVYEATLGPWLKYLSFRKDNFLFHDATLAEQTACIFQDYLPQAVWNLRLYEQYSCMTDACQFDESDHNYLHRRWEAAGWLYWYEHTKNGHTLILCDNSREAAAIDGGPEIAFHQHGGSQEEDAISAWSSVRHLTPAKFALSGFNFKDPVPRNISLPTLNRQGKVAHIETYEYAGSYQFKNLADGDRMTRLRLEELEAGAKHFEAAGNNRHVQPGRWFSLLDYCDDKPFDCKYNASVDEFLILEVHHSVTNNYLQDQTAHYSNRLSCIRKAIPWRPGRSFNSVDTKIVAPQTATVVGAKGQGSIDTDQYGRVRVQFHWDRIGKNDDLSSAWVRVASSWAGAQLGAAAIPRVGCEVIVQWLDGSPDRPIITGSVCNEYYLPPWRLPAQQALSGLRSRELSQDGGNYAGGRSNHLILDDTNRQIQAQLKSDHQHSQLSLGQITRIEGNAGRTDARGEGWELASNAWGVARAGKGMLITTEARTNAASHIKDMGETVQRLATAQAQHAAQAKTAQQHGAQEQQAQQGEVAAAIKLQNDAIQGASSGKGAGVFPELAAPHLVLASPAGIETSTARSTHLASGEHAAITTGKSVSISTGESLFASISHTFRLFVHKAGMKLVAAAGKVTIEAQSDQIELIANQVLTLISESDWVDIRGKKGVRLHGATCMVEIGDQIQVFAPTPTLFHGSLETLAPKNFPQPPAGPPAEAPPQHLQFTLNADHGNQKPYANVPYSLYKNDVKVEHALTDEFGRIFIEHQAGTPKYRVQLATGEEFVLPVTPEPSQSNQDMRALNGTPESRQRS